MDSEKYTARVKDFLDTAFAIDNPEEREGISLENPSRYYVVCYWGGGLVGSFQDVNGLFDIAYEKYYNNYDDSFDLAVLDVERNVEVEVRPVKWEIIDS